MKSHPASRHPDLIVGVGGNDDAGVIRLSDELALVQTVDFFTPVVDDPYDWGRIAAANALSDLYAMGAEPFTALQLVGWPRDTLSFDLLGRVLQGGADVMAEAGCVIVGGHSIDDTEPKYGFAVSGTVHPDRVLTNGGAQPGDALVLTKPIGTGIIATAIKRGGCPPQVRDKAVEVMVRLNRWEGASLYDLGAGAVTDVTGFGLLGHLAEILDASGVSAELDVASIPVLEGARELLAEGMFPGGSERNLASVAGRIGGQPNQEDVRLLADAQTSGGLLISLATGDVATGDMATGEVKPERGIPGGVVIGRIVEGDGQIYLR